MLIKSQSIKSLIAFILLFSTPIFASEVEIVYVVLTESSDSWGADVTLKHADTGWKHYADGWRLVDEQGNIIGNRILYHPHVNEQPFTRSLSGMHIKKEQKFIFVEAHDFKRGWSANKVKIDFDKPSAVKYKIISR